MSLGHEVTVQALARTLSDIGHALESVDGASERIQRVLDLTRGLIPYGRCMLMLSQSAGTQDLFVVPDAPAEQRHAVRMSLARVLKMFERAEDVPSAVEGRTHLTLPVIGLDEVLGVIRLEPGPHNAFDVPDVQLLSVIAVQLGSYMALIRLRERDADHVAQLTAAHDFQQLLVGVVSHDLRSPLSVIINVAQTLKRSAMNDVERVAAARTLRSARHATTIINDLLDVTHARVTQGMRIAPRAFDLRTTLVDIVGDVGLAYPGRVIELIAPDAPWTRGEWDPERLTQAATNLLVNALAHGSENGPVQVRLECNEDSIAIAVHNDGPPIPEERLLTLLDPFKRGGDQARVIGGGLGLGLYIVDQIARAHGGRVTVHSNDVDGTTFRIELPPSKLLSSAATIPDEQPKPVTPPRSVVLIDDSDDMRATFRKVLERRGHLVTEARDGEEGLACILAERPDVALIDIGLPGIDGYELARRVRSASAHSVMLVAMTGYGGESAREEALSAGFDSHMTKPVEIEQVERIFATIRDRVA